MSVNLDRFACGVEPSIPDEVGNCVGCGGMMYDYEVVTCPLCGEQVHQGCQVRCDRCGTMGCKACFEKNDDSGEFFCGSECRWSQYNDQRKAEKKENYDRAVEQFETAQTLARDNGFILVQKSPWHFSLIRYENGQKVWLLNLYPSNQRLYWDQHHRGPFLPVTKPWTFVDVVRAAVEKMS